MLGSLVVRLGLDAADFISGMTKSEQQAKRFASGIEKNIAAGIIKAEVAMRSLGAAARVTFDVFQSLTLDAAAFKDLEETTGASAEQLAGLAVAAATAGVPMENIAGSVNKLTKSLVGVDDESKAAGAALSAIGISVKEFKDLDPASQYEAVGKALAGFEDSAGKVAVAQALFGKAGAEQLKVFKALEEQGGRQTILTQRQIELSDAYADAQARAGKQLQLYAQAAASEAIPALTDLQSVAVDVAKEFLGIDKVTGQLAANNGAKVFAESVADSFAFAGDQVLLFSRLLEVTGKGLAAYAAVSKALLSANLSEARAIGAEFKRDFEEINSRLTLAQRLANQRKESASFVGNESSAETARLSRAGSKPRITFAGAVKPERAGGGGKSTAVDEAARYLESLQKQLQATKDLSVEETVLADIRSGRLGKVNAGAEAQLLAVAQQIDAARRLSDQLKAEKDQEEDFRRARKEIADEAARAYEATRTPVEKLNIELERQKRLLDELGPKYQDVYERSVGAARDAYLEAANLNKEIEKGNDIAQELGLTFSSAFEDAIVGGKNLRDVLSALEDDIIRIVTRKLVTEPLANAVTGLIGGASGGGGLLASIGGLFGGLFADGGNLPAGRWGIVGERGPELVTGPANVIPHNRSMAMLDRMAAGGGNRSIVVNPTFHLSGPVTARTQQQIAAQTARSVAVANARAN